MSNVRVVQAASSCFPSTQGLAVATDEAQLTRYLADDSISMIQIAADITLQPGPWQVGTAAHSRRHVQGSAAVPRQQRLQ